jgi:hypothetical protein
LRSLFFYNFAKKAIFMFLLFTRKKSCQQKKDAIKNR